MWQRVEKGVDLRPLDLTNQSTAFSFINIVFPKVFVNFLQA